MNEKAADESAEKAGNSEVKGEVSEKKAEKQAPKRGSSRAGINISGEKVITGNNTIGNVTTTNINNYPSEKEKDGTRKRAAVPAIKSAWANGLFYLFAFVVVVGVIGWLARQVSISALVVIILAGLLAVPIVGAFQLKMDNRLKEKGFLELVGMVLKQLPLIGKAIK